MCSNNNNNNSKHWYRACYVPSKHIVLDLILTALGGRFITLFSSEEIWPERFNNLPKIMQLVNWSCLDFNLDRLLQSQRLPHSPFPFVSGIAKVVEVEVCRGWFSVYFPGVVWFLEYQPEHVSRFIHRMQTQVCGWGKSTGMVCRDELEGHTHHVHVLIWQQTCGYESWGKAGTEASVSCLRQALFPHGLVLLT